MGLPESIMLERVVAVLKKQGVDVHFVESDNEGIEIGELKNGRITLNTRSRDKLSMVFTIAHLYGHYNQFRNYSKYKHLIETVEKHVPIQLGHEFKQEFWEYEKEAFGIGKTLMNESFSVTEEIDQKYQTFMVTDFEHFWNYITTGTGESISEFNDRLVKNYLSYPKFEKPIEAVPISKFTGNETINSQVTIF